MTDFDLVKSNLNVAYRCWYHVVWCPKWRRKVLTSNDPRVANPPIAGDPGPVDERLAEIIRDWAEETGSEIAGLEIMPDHVHLLVSVDPQYGIGTSRISATSDTDSLTPRLKPGACANHIRSPQKSTLCLTNQYTQPVE